MLAIGLIGGLSFPSTIMYYDRINRLANQRLGKAHSPHIIIDSLDFQPVADWLTAYDGDSLTRHLIESARRLANAGADCFVMCCNTVHKYADVIQRGSPIPLINICDCTAAYAKSKNLSKVGLLGSAYSMEESFYTGAFKRQGIEVLIPEKDDRMFIQGVIERELSVGAVSPATKSRFVRVAEELAERGAQSIVLACTEIPLVVRPEDVSVPVIDTVSVHSTAIVDYAMNTSHPTGRST